MRIIRGGSGGEKASRGVIEKVGFRASDATSSAP